MAAEIIHVFRFDYRLKNEDWHAFIAGYNQEECQDYLFKLAPNAQVMTVSQESRLDAISDNLRAKIKDAGKRKPGRPAKKKE